MQEFETPTEEALELWQEIIGIRAGQNGRMTIGQWESARTLTALKEAFELDTSEITATLLLRHFLRTYAADTTVPLAMLLDEPEALNAKINKIKRLNAILTREDVEDQVDAFSAAIRRGLEHYHMQEREDVLKVVSSPENLGILRRDALRSMSQLKVDQFFDGEGEKPGTKPVYHGMVHQWWNINSMLEAAFSAPSGISLNLIREPNDYHSFFAFMIKNGRNLFVLSDVSQFAHPMQGHMSRRPDREMGERIARNWFPYDLLNLAYDEDGRMFFAESASKSLVPHQGAALPVKPISALEPFEAVWTIMMFDLIVDRFWKKGFKAPSLSYTGEMVKVQDKLLQAAHKAGLPALNYQLINVDALTVDDVFKAEEKDGVGKQPFNTNRWMEERYKDRVAEAIINAIASPEKRLLVESKGDSSSLVEMGGSEVAKLGYFDKKALEDSHDLIRPLDATSFGSRDQLLKDRMFMARYNYAHRIKKLAWDEFDERKKAVLDWYKKAILDNRAALISLAGNDMIWLKDELAGFGTYYHGNNAGIRYNADDGRPALRSFNRLVNLKKRNYDEPRLSGAVNLENYTYSGDLPCALTGAISTYGVLFLPVNAEELAILTGKDVRDLPDVLQHWNIAQLYSGNSILDRIDPVEWVIKNPWANLDLRVGVPLSIRGMKQARKTSQIPDQLTSRICHEVPNELKTKYWKL